jgi:hypothetical protein
VPATTRAARRPTPRCARARRGRARQLAGAVGASQRRVEDRRLSRTVRAQLLVERTEQAPCAALDCARARARRTAKRDRCARQPHCATTSGMALLASMPPSRATRVPADVEPGR